MRAEALRIVEEVKKVISQYDVAMTLRQIYYRLVAGQIIPNLQKYYAQLSRICVIARDEGLLPETAFADRLRQPQKPPSWLDLNDFMNTVKRAYNKDKWVNQANYIEIWTEKDALRGVIGEITNKYDVTLLVVRGQVSRTAIYEAGQRFEKKRCDEKKGCYLMYYGDFDPSGLTIYKSLCERLENFSFGINYHREALTPEQIEKYKLPEDPAKQSDPSYRKFVAEYGDNVVELDSLPPDVLQKMIEDTIRSRIDDREWNKSLKIEKQEVKKLQGIVF